MIKEECRLAADGDKGEKNGGAQEKEMLGIKRELEVRSERVSCAWRKGGTP